MRLLRRGSIRRLTLTVAISVLVFVTWSHVGHTPREEVSYNLIHPLMPHDATSQPLKSPQPRTTQSDGHATHRRPSNQSQVPESSSRNSSAPYSNTWVGFPDLSTDLCPQAFSAKTSNSLFPQKVKRKFPAQFISASQNCSKFTHNFGFDRYPAASKEELEFPLAFIVVFHKDLDQVLYLLRALYRPHNVYCLSVDTKASVEFLEAVRSVSFCLPNVFLASKLENIVYAGFTRLMADIDCMDDLLRHPVQWKYVINMPGQQFPLRSNLELVRILTLYRGANDIEGIVDPHRLPHRFQLKHIYVTDDSGNVAIEATGEKHQAPPHQLDVVKGSAYGTFSRAFVQFVVSDPVARDLLEWTKAVKSPDEYFWSTLHHRRTGGVPGGYTGPPDKKPWLSVYASWAGRDPCNTLHTRGVCILSPEDLPHLVRQPHLMVNKFYISHHPAALHCLDQLLFNLTVSGTVRDLGYYRNLSFALS